MRRYAKFVERIKGAIVQSSAETSPELRGALLASDLSRVPANLSSYVAKVRDQAWRISDDDVAALKAAGYSEDQIFELTATAAVGAALMRLERALAAVGIAE